MYARPIRRYKSTPGQGRKKISRIHARAALDYAEAAGLTVMPLCSYVRGYFRRHPERQGLLAPGSRI
jgi:predicted GNAT family acetyltransferase